MRTLCSHLTAASPQFDACKYYQTLAESPSAGCDNGLDSWYRFTGNAGTRMVDSCPNLNSHYPRCKANWQGWLTSSHPAVNDGEVNKTVCFSSQGSCSCNYYKEIKVINCGYFYVYYLDGVPRCNATYCGVKGNFSHIKFSQKNSVHL